MSVAHSVSLVVAPPHPAGRPFLWGALAVFLLGLLVWHPLAWMALIFGLFCLYFFRDPDRVPPLAPGAVLAPADGRVTLVDHAVPPEELGLGPLPRPRVCIFLSVLDVHVNRMPVDATVTCVAYRHGLFLNASLDKASADNERNAIALRLPDGRRMAVVQIAGLIARRILCDVREGDAVAAGGRFGIIRFGSRTDLYLPEGTVPLVRVGQTMIGGETVVAMLAAPAEPDTMDAIAAVLPP
jgi:phosphatidylserine decarboxylase